MPPFRFSLKTCAQVLLINSFFAALPCLAQGTGGSVREMLPPLERTSPTPVSNCKESGGNNRPTGAGEKGFQADMHRPANNQLGSEHLGTNGDELPGHSSKEMGQAVQSGGPQPCSEKNQKSPTAKPQKGTETGGTTQVQLVSAFGTKIDQEPYIKLDPAVDGPDRTEHTKGGWADNQSPAGLNCGEKGQGEGAACVMNSQTVPVAGQWAGMLAAQADSFTQQVPNPRGWAKVAKGVQQAQNAQNSDNQGNCCRQNCQNSFQCMKLPLINVANEQAASPCTSEAPFKDEANVVWMVQQMYKKCYVPMAVLFLLPGAVITQAKSVVSYGVLGTQDEDTTSPFAGIFRSMMAVFLIPATQLVVSYCIDIGNALTEPVAQRIQVETLMDWVMEQAYASDPKNNDGCIKNVQANMGKLAGTSVKQVVQERQNDLNVTVQNTLNTVNGLLSQGLEVLNGFQLVMMCYLFLLGPIAAAFYAWPAAIGNSLFKKAFASWLDGVIVLSLWKFWWCIVLLCMVVRLQSGNINPSSQYEMYYFTAFMTILVWVPFQPFEFRPGDMVDKVLERAQQAGGGGGGAGAGGGKAGGASGQGGTAQSGAASGGTSQGTASQKTAGGANPSLSQDGPVGAGKANSAESSSTESGTKSNSSGPMSVSYAADPIGPVNMNDALTPPPPRA